MTTEPTIRSKPERRPVIGVLCRDALDSPIYRPWIESPNENVEIRIIADFEVAQELPPEVDLLVTHNHYRWDELAVLRKTMNANDRGVLVLADGITEFRNSWQNPRTPVGSLMQPAMAHKIATLGAAQSRLWESWGNAGKCEVVGLPRLDQRAQRFGWWNPSEVRSGNDGEALGQTTPPTLLICSARTPAFSDAQWEVALAQFTALHRFLSENRPVTAGQPVIVRWRVADRVREHLQLSPQQCSTGDVAEAIDDATAIITTPSTLQLEAMLARRPVAVLDFFNVPLYVPAAWLLTSPDQFPAVVSGLLDPPADRMFYQQSVLRDQLWCDSSSIERMWTLLEGMAQIAQRQRSAGRPIRFPEQILPTSQSPGGAIDWAKLFPDRQRWLDQAIAEHASPWELTEVSAALIRAREYSEERRQLHYLTNVHQQTVDTYESALKDKKQYIDYLQSTLSEIQERVQVLSELLDKRNSEFEVLNRRIIQLAADKVEAHRQLTEAHADGKRKQERVNELRTHYQQIREAHAKLKTKLDALLQNPPNSTS